MFIDISKLGLIALFISKEVNRSGRYCVTAKANNLNFQDNYYNI